MLTQASVAREVRHRTSPPAHSFSGARQFAEAKLRELRRDSFSTKVMVAPEIEGRLVHRETGESATSVSVGGKGLPTLDAIGSRLPGITPEHCRDKFELVTPGAWEFKPGCYKTIIESFEEQYRALCDAASYFNLDARLTQSLRYPTEASAAQDLVVSGTMPPFVAGYTPRCKDIVWMCEEHHAYRPRRICLGNDAGTYDLYSWMLGQKVGVHVNSSAPVAEWSALRRAGIATNAILLALSADSPLLCPLGSDELQRTGVMAFRHYDFPGCLFGHGEDGRPRWVESSPGGHPVDGPEGIRNALLAMMDSERPIFSNPGDDPKEQFWHVLKLSYVWLRQRLEDDHIRDENRGIGACANIRTSVAMMALAHAGRYAFMEAFGDGSAIPYEECTKNDWNAIKYGLDAEIAWIGDSGLIRVPLKVAARRLIDATRDYYRQCGLGEDEIELVCGPLDSIVDGTGPLASKLLAWYNQGVTDWRDLDDVTAAWSGHDIGSWPLDWEKAHRGPCCS